MKKPFQLNVAGEMLEFQVHGYERRPLPHSSEKWKIEQIRCLPTIARLSRERLLALHTYSELQFEAWKKPNSFPFDPNYSLFSGIPIEDLYPSIQRSRYFELPMEEYLSQGCMVRFCQWLIHSDGEQIFRNWVKRSRATEFEDLNLRSLDRYRELSKGLSNAQLPDAFHLWTAEVNSMDYFLTTDKKFIRSIQQNKGLTPKCMPICPSDLINSLGVAKLDPLPDVPGR